MFWEIPINCPDLHEVVCVKPPFSNEAHIVMSDQPTWKFVLVAILSQILKQKNPYVIATIPILCASNHAQETIYSERCLSCPLYPNNRTNGIYCPGHLPSRNLPPYMHKPEQFISSHQPSVI